MLSAITRPLIALLTDFGTSDPYVGIMKGVMIGRCPSVRFIDITHEVGPQNIAQASYLLHSAYRYFPPHTIFLVVVDPSVGSERRPVAIHTSHGAYVGPDNGVFSMVLDEVEAWHAVILWPPEHMSNTFHGRDLFASVAADLASGRPLSEVGTPTVDLVRSSVPRVRRIAETILEGTVLHIDHFGNIITSLGMFEWRDRDHRLLTLDNNEDISLTLAATDARVLFKGYELIGIQATYGDAPPGELLALVNSNKCLEIAINQRNAAQLMGAALGDTIQLVFNVERN